MEALSQNRQLLLARIAIGLFQGLVLYLLYSAADAKAWPATQGLLFAPLLLVSLAAPLGLNLSLGAMSWRRSAIWVAGASTVLALLGFFDNWMNGPWEWWYDGSARPHILPSWQLFVFGAGALFIAQALFTGGTTDRRFRATYHTHFDVAWKLAVQLALAALFTGVFWLLLWLGASLFQLIKLDFLEKLLGHEWFSIPMLSLAVASGIHLTDIRPTLVEGARTLLLTLLSWLLPVIALLVGGFVISLPFTGLTPLWGFGHATQLLLLAAAALIILINAAYQDGAAERRPPAVLRLAAKVAAVLTVPLTMIAAYALFLRVSQYGWTVDRVTVAAILVVALAYAGGYAWAALDRAHWLARLEPWNFNISLLVLALIVALFTPLLSPQRISVNSQVARLRSGTTTPQKFDFAYLREHGGRYGDAALAELAKDGDPLLRRRAQATLERRLSGRTLTPSLLADLLTVYPKGQKLPQSFLNTDWKRVFPGQTGGCLISTNSICDVAVLDLDGDQRPEVLLLDGFEIQVFHESPGGWGNAGTINFPWYCRAAMDELKAGKFRVAPPSHAWNDILIGEARLRVVEPEGRNGCSGITGISGPR